MQQKYWNEGGSVVYRRKDFYQTTVYCFKPTNQAKITIYWIVELK